MKLKFKRKIDEYIYIYIIDVLHAVKFLSRKILKILKRNEKNEGSCPRAREERRRPEAGTASTPGPGLVAPLPCFSGQKLMVRRPALPSQSRPVRALFNFKSLFSTT